MTFGLLTHSLAPHLLLSLSAARREGNSGAPEHPGWYLNLEANPEAVIQVKGDVIPVTARTASPEEKQRLWPIMLEQWPYYDEYQAKTDRDIPLVILSPR